MNEKNICLTSLLEAAALCLISSPVVASVVTYTANLPVPQTTSGIYLNLVTGASSTVASNVAGWDINPWGSSALRFYWQPMSTNGAGMVDPVSGALLNLHYGDVVDSAATFKTGNPSPTAFQKTAYDYVGVAFTNETTGPINYGFLEMSSTAPAGLPGIIVAFAFEDSGGPITVESIEGIFRDGYD